MTGHDGESSPFYAHIVSPLLLVIDEINKQIKQTEASFQGRGQGGTEESKKKKKKTNKLKHKQIKETDSTCKACTHRYSGAQP